MEISTENINTQNGLLLKNLMDFYENKENLEKLLNIVNGETKISLRIIDWFVTNYSKKYFIVYNITIKENEDLTDIKRFKVYNDYKLKLKAYSKKKFDPFCRWDRISIPFGENEYMETTLGQLNFFKWAITNGILDYIEEHYNDIEVDMNQRNTTSKKKGSANGGGAVPTVSGNDVKTRKKREELSVSACKTMKKEFVEIVIKFK